MLRASLFGATNYMFPRYGAKMRKKARCYARLKLLSK
jgi:hypothetical protein